MALVSVLTVEAGYECCSISWGNTVGLGDFRHNNVSPAPTMGMVCFTARGCHLPVVHLKHNPADVSLT